METHRNIIKEYTFNANAKTVSFDEYSSTGISIERVFLIMNARTADILYLPGDKSLIASVTDNIISLNDSVSTTLMNDSDELLIIYDEDSVPNALDRTIDNVTSRREAAKSKTLSSSGVVSNAACQLEAVIVCSTSGGAITLYDNASAASGTTILPSTALSVGIYDLHSIGEDIVNGVYCSLSGVITVVFVYYIK